MPPTWHLKSLRKPVLPQSSVAGPMSTFVCIKCERKEALTSCLTCDGGLCRKCWDVMHNKLMRQIDLMVSAKKAEWENHLHAVHIQLEKRNKEIGFMKTQLEQKTQEVDRLQHNVKDMEMAQRGVIDEYEQHVIHLKEEVDNLKYEHEKLQKKTGKQAFHVEKERDQLVADLKIKDSELQRLNDRLEECKIKTSDFEEACHAWEDRINALENQKKTLLEKSDLYQQQILGYQSQLNKRRHMMEDLEHGHQQQLQDLQYQIKRLKEEDESKEDTIKELKSSLDNAISGGRQQASDVGQLQEDMRVALDAIQQLEDENGQLKAEIQSRDDLIQVAEEDQEQHADDIMKLEQSLILKDEVIRKFEAANTRTENLELRQLKEDLRTSRIEMQSRADNEAFLKEELNHANQKLENSNKVQAKLQSQLKRKEDEVKRIQEEELQILVDERNKLQERVFSLEEGHVGAVKGMQSEVESLASELHRRDTSMADVSERLQRIEKDLRDATTRYDRCASELQVTNAQLEALRLENKHLRDSARDQLDMSDVYKGNMEFIAELENENRELRIEVVKLREQLCALEASQHQRLRHALTDIKDNEIRQHEQQSDAERKVSALESRLETTIRKYETQIHFLQSENERLKMGQTRRLSNPTGSPHSSKPGHIPRPQDISHTSNSDYTDTEALVYADLTGPVATAERSTGGSRRTSFTADFVAEENRRERELERIVDGRIADLKADTDLIMGKYS